MKKENQVCCLKLSQRLKELGVKQKSYFVWFKLKEKSKWSLSESWQIDDVERFDEISAFTCAELGEMLGTHAESTKGDNGWYMRMISPIQKWKDMFPCKTEADARAKMLIYLLENKLMELPNDRTRKNAHYQI